MVIVLFGVAGAGKTRIGAELAAALGWAFVDADDLHEPAAIEKLRSGIALTDEDRAPWLDRLRRDIASRLRTGQQAVLACSALKQAYRTYLRIGNDVVFVYLKADPALLQKRLRERPHHFMNPSLLTSQLETLEEPHDGSVVVDATAAPQDIVQTIQQALAL